MALGHFHPPLMPNSIFFLSYHILLGFPSARFPAGFVTTLLHASVVSYIRAMFTLSHLYTSWLYSPLRTLSFFGTGAHSSLLLASLTSLPAYLNSRSFQTITMLDSPRGRSAQWSGCVWTRLHGFDSWTGRGFSWLYQVQTNLVLIRYWDHFPCW
jgi:hypothetical protein